MSFRKPIKDDFVDHYPMAKPVELHDAHVIEYSIETLWNTYKAEFRQPFPEEQNHQGWDALAKYIDKLMPL